MKRATFLLIISVVALLFVSETVFAQWKTSKDVDEMTGNGTSYAISPKVTATERMGFPYGDTEAWLGVGTDGDNEWAYIGFTKEPNIKNTDPGDGYSAFTTRVKWDDDIKQMKFTQDWGSRFIHFLYYDKAISEMINNNKVLVELDWYGEDKVYFEFTLNGSANAIEEIRNNSN